MTEDAQALDLTWAPSSTPCDTPEGDWDEEEADETSEDISIKSEVTSVMRDLWEPQGEMEVCDALKRLLSLAQKQSHMKVIRSAGAIPILVDIIRSAESLGAPSHLSPPQSLAVECIFFLSKSLLSRIEIGETGGLHPLASCLRIKDSKDVVTALRCLKECSKSPLKNRSLLRKAGFIDSLIALLVRESEDVLFLVLDTLSLYNDQESQRVLSLSLLSLILHFIRIFEINLTLRQAIHYGNGLPLVIRLTNTSTHEVRQKAMRTLRILCADNIETQTFLHKTNAIECIVTQLGSQDEGVQISAAECLFGLTLNDFKNQSSARKSGAVPLLVALLRSPSERVCVCACAAVKGLARNNVKVQSEFREARGMKAITSLLEEKGEGVAIAALTAVSDEGIGGERMGM